MVNGTFTLTRLAWSHTRCVGRGDLGPFPATRWDGRLRHHATFHMDFDLEPDRHHVFKIRLVEKGTGAHHDPVFPKNGECHTGRFAQHLYFGSGGIRMDKQWKTKPWKAPPGDAARRTRAPVTGGRHLRACVAGIQCYYVPVFSLAE